MLEGEGGEEGEGAKEIDGGRVKLEYISQISRLLLKDEPTKSEAKNGQLLMTRVTLPPLSSASSEQLKTKLQNKSDRERCVSRTTSVDQIKSENESDDLLSAQTCERWQC